MNWIVNNIWLIWKFACMLRTYRTYNPTLRFSKYKLNNKLLSDVTLLRVNYITQYIGTQLSFEEENCSKNFFLR